MEDSPRFGERIVNTMTRAWPLRSVAALVLVSLVGFVTFFWPFMASSDSVVAENSTLVPFVFALLLPLILGVILAQIADGGLDAKRIAMLGILAAIGTALRPLGTGIAGFEPVFIILAIGGCALGPSFGFTLGMITMMSSALVTGGVGPWLPFQMIAAGWFGLGAGWVGTLRSRRLMIVVLAIYGFFGSVLYGFLLNLQFWPWALGVDSQISFVPGAAVVENLQRWFAFEVTTSLGFDIPRGIMTALAIALIGAPALRAIRRVTRMASFGPPADTDSRPAHSGAVPGR